MERFAADEMGEAKEDAGENEDGGEIGDGSLRLDDDVLARVAEVAGRAGRAGRQRGKA